MERRVVVTGMGTINPLAESVDETWSSLLNGKSGIKSIEELIKANEQTNGQSYRCTVGGQVQISDFSKYNIDPKLASKMEDFQKYSFCAMKEAALMARLPMHHPDDYNVIFDDFKDMASPVDDPFRMGVMLGIGVGGIKVMEEQVGVLNEKGPRRVSPYLIPKLISNLGGGYIAQSLGAKGVNTCFVTACASGTNAIGESMLAIKNNRADIIVTGGLEATCCRIGFAGFGNMHALSTLNEDPTTACRPFDKTRNGFVMSEGGAILVLEEFEHARRRGVPILAEVVGYSLTNDAFNITNPDPSGVAVCRAMTDAISSAGIKVSDIDYINAHGTSTLANDRMEVLSIKSIYNNDENLYSKVSISSTKSMTGHMLGGAGAFEALVCVKACQTDMIPPTINLREPDVEMQGLDLVPNVAKNRVVNYAMSNSFGFGGHNAVLVVKKYIE